MTLNAAVTLLSVPDTVDQGESFAVRVRVANTGTEPWNDLEKFKLGFQSPQDNMTWGLSRIPLPEPLQAGGVLEIEAQLKATTNRSRRWWVT